MSNVVGAPFIRPAISESVYSLEEAKDIAQEVLDKGIVITLSEDIALDPAKIKDLA